MTLTRDRSRLWVLLAAGSLAVMPGAVIAPVLREIVIQFQLDQAVAGYLVSMHYLTVALFSPILGILADRIGRVRVLVASLLLFAIFGVAGAWTTSFLPMLITRALLGITTGGIAAASLGILAQLYQPGAARTQAIALASSTLTLANIVYPLLAGLVGARGWQAAFYLYGLGLPLSFLVASQLSDPPAARSETSSILGKAKLPSILRQFQVLRFLITLTLTSATAYAVVIYLPLYLKAGTLINGMVLALQAIGSAIASAVGIQLLARRFDLTTSIGIGFGAMATALLFMAAISPQQLGLIAPAALLFGLGMGVVMPTHYSVLANLTPPDLQATILAAGTGMTFLGQFLSPTLFGVVLSDGHPISVFYAAAATALSTGLFLFASTRFADRTTA